MPDTGGQQAIGDVIVSSLFHFSFLFGSAITNPKKRIMKNFTDLIPYIIKEINEQWSEILIKDNL